MGEHYYLEEGFDEDGVYHCYVVHQSAETNWEGKELILNEEQTERLREKLDELSEQEKSFLKELVKESK